MDQQQQHAQLAQKALNLCEVGYRFLIESMKTYPGLKEAERQGLLQDYGEAFDFMGTITQHYKKKANMSPTEPTQWQELLNFIVNTEKENKQHG